MEMRNDGGRNNNGGMPGSMRTFSAYLKAVSAGASTVVKSAASAASAAIADRERDTETAYDQVFWAGYDKLEYEGDVTRRVLLLGFRFGFQVWDVEEANNVRELICRYDGPVSFLQLLPEPRLSKHYGDKFAGIRPLLAVCADVSFPKSGYVHDGLPVPRNGNIQNSHDQFSSGFLPTVVWFYSMRSQSYINLLKFRSVVYSVRCSSSVIAVLQAAQIHCFNAATLEREYTILTNPIVNGDFVSGNLGLGPLAVGPRWMAYSGPPEATSHSARVNPQHLAPSASSTSSASSGSLVAHYAKESSKQLAAGIVTLGDMGYKKLSHYCSELLPDCNNSQQGTSGWKDQGIGTGPSDADNVGMVIVRDVVDKSVIAQFRAHQSPISSLIFDPSGALLVTASVHGHNINVFRIKPEHSGSSSEFDSGSSYVHLYRLQRGYTNAVIQDICFSDESNWIMISSSRGTSHIYSISPYGGKVDIPYSDAPFSTKNSGSDGVTKPLGYGPSSSGLQMLTELKLCESGSPVALSAVTRIKNGNSGWRSTVTGAAACATGRMGSFCAAITSAFQNCKNNDFNRDNCYLKALIFSPSGCVIQYALRMSSRLDGAAGVSRLSPSYDLGVPCDARFVVEPIQKWSICQKQSQRARESNTDIYGDNGYSDSSKIFPEEMRNGMINFPKGKGTVTKVKIIPEERHNMHISEAELHMHLRLPLVWARSEIYFQTIIKDDMNIGEEDATEGEIQIERITVRMIEARSKNLVPVFDHQQIPKLQMSSGLPLIENYNGGLVLQSLGISDNGELICGNNRGSHDATDGSAVLSEYQNNTENSGADDLVMPEESTEGLVYTKESPSYNTRPLLVNNRSSYVKEPKQKFVK